MATKQGRPRGVNVNPVAVEDFLACICGSKTELATASDVTVGHLSDMLHRQKGASPATVRKMAAYLRCRPEAIAPELTRQFVAVRAGDPVPEPAA